MNEYFPHDYHARNDQKMIEIYLCAGWEGRAIFWDLVEMMYEEGGRLKLTKIDEYAYALRTDKECIEKVISVAFKKNKEFFWSESVLKRIELRNEKSLKAKASAQRRWSDRDANAMPTHNEGNAIKEKKRKEKKIYTAASPVLETKDRKLGNTVIPKPVPTNEWQMLAVDYAQKLGFTPSPSWFKLFKDNFTTNRGRLLSAYQTTVDRAARNPELFFYKVFGGHNAPRTT